MVVWVYDIFKCFERPQFLSLYKKLKGWKKMGKIDFWQEFALRSRKKKYFQDYFFHYKITEVERNWLITTTNNSKSLQLQTSTLLFMHFIIYIYIWHSFFNKVDHAKNIMSKRMNFFSITSKSFSCYFCFVLFSYTTNN